MSNQPKKKVVEEKVVEKEVEVEKQTQERIHPFDSFWNLNSHKQEEEVKPSEKVSSEEESSEEESKGPFWF